MSPIRKRGGPVTLLKRRLILVGLLALVGVGVFGVWNIYQKERESAALKGEAEMRAADLRERKAELEENIANLQTDRGKEAALRQGYALAKEGEGLIVIVDNEAQIVPAASSSAFAEWLHNTFPWW